MLSDQSRTIEQAKFAYSPLRKAFEKQTKIIEERGKKQVEDLEVLDPEKFQKDFFFSKKMRNDEIKNKIDEIKIWENKIKRKDLIYEANVIENMIEFNNQSRSRSKEDKNKKWNTFNSVSVLYEGRELTLNAFRSGIFPIKEKKRKRIKIINS